VTIYKPERASNRVLHRFEPVHFGIFFASKERKVHSVDLAIIGGAVAPN
jgi:hypothetical protein